MKKMKTPHDNLFRETFSRRENALSFLKIYLPPVLLEAVDLQSLEICKDSFIEKELEDYFSDMLYKVELAGSPGYIYVLLEHKSYDDKYLHLQLLEYMIKIWRLFLKQHENENNSEETLSVTSRKRAKNKPPLPIVLPILIYHGDSNWPQDRRRFSSLLSGPVSLFSDYIPDFTFMLHDLTALPDDEIKGAVMLKVMQLLFKHVQDTDIMDKLPGILLLLRDVLDARTGMESLVAVFKYLFNTIDGVSAEDIKNIVEHALSKKEGGLVMTLAEKLRMEGREEGREEGEVIGRIQLYHEILGETVPSKKELNVNSIEILREMLKQIEQRWMRVKSE